MEYIQRALKSLHSDYMSYANTGENDKFINIFEKKWSSSHECDEKARSKQQPMRQSWLPGLCQLAYYLPSTSTCPNTYSVNCQPTCVGGEPCSDGPPEISLQRCPKADIWLTALKRLSQPRLDFYKWLACFLHLFVTSKSRITIIFKDYLLLVQPEPCLETKTTWHKHRTKDSPYSKSLHVKHVPWKQSSNWMNINKLTSISL